MSATGTCRRRCVYKRIKKLRKRTGRHPAQPDIRHPSALPFVGTLEGAEPLRRPLTMTSKQLHVTHTVETTTCIVVDLPIYAAIISARRQAQSQHQGWRSSWPSLPSVMEQIEHTTAICVPITTRHHRQSWVLPSRDHIVAYSDRRRALCRKGSRAPTDSIAAASRHCSRHSNSGRDDEA